MLTTYAELIRTSVTKCKHSSFIRYVLILCNANALENLMRDNVINRDFVLSRSIYCGWQTEFLLLHCHLDFVEGSSESPRYVVITARMSLRSRGLMGYVHHFPIWGCMNCMEHGQRWGRG
ncbi:hypothetical protein J6590_073998 [Homalodisca vitripennis]|nr:hypothetical protein J6590_073998 [Homalodisca vitripennis]